MFPSRVLWMILFFWIFLWRLVSSKDGWNDFVCISCDYLFPQRYFEWLCLYSLWRLVLSKGFEWLCLYFLWRLFSLMLSRWFEWLVYVFCDDVDVSRVPWLTCLYFLWYLFPQGKALNDFFIFCLWIFVSHEGALNDFVRISCGDLFLARVLWWDFPEYALVR